MAWTVPPWLAAAVTGGALVLGTALESARPLRRRVAPALRRRARNLAMGAVSLLVAGPLQLLLVLPLARSVHGSGLGMLGLVELPPGLELAAALLLLDYTLWSWHWANHRVPLLWRFHAVHHADPDMDASTALRFHFGELALAALFRCAQVALVGASPSHVALSAMVLTASALFHHSNLRLPFGLERRLVHLVVTPRMHGIHHSVVREERDSNYSSVLSAWDRLHGTLRLDVPQEDVTIGLPSREDQRLLPMLARPFRRTRAPTREPLRPPTGRPTARLAP